MYILRNKISSKEIEWDETKNALLKRRRGICFEVIVEALVRAARASLAKNRHISIRLSEKDLMRLRAKALELGLPYQTLIGSILHQYAEGKVKASF